MVGTTGFTEADLDELAGLFVRADGAGPRAHCIVAANFAIGAVLMMRFAALAAPWFDGAEIIELHHEAKRDAPSGTSLRTAEGMAAARADAGARRVPARRHDDRGGGRAPGAEPDPAASGSTRSGCPAWWPTRRCSSDRPARA